MKCVRLEPVERRMAFDKSFSHEQSRRGRPNGVIVAGYAVLNGSGVISAWRVMDGELLIRGKPCPLLLLAGAPCWTSLALLFLNVGHSPAAKQILECKLTTGNLWIVGAAR